MIVLEVATNWTGTEVVYRGQMGTGLIPVEIAD